MLHKIEKIYHIYCICIVGISKHSINMITFSINRKYAQEHKYGKERLGIMDL